MTLERIISKSNAKHWPELVPLAKKFHERIGIDNSRGPSVGLEVGFEMLVVNPKQLGRGAHDGPSWSTQEKKVDLQALGLWLIANNVNYVVQASTGKCMTRFVYIMELGRLQGDRI